MNTDRFDFDSGALCLDFSNTVEWRNGEQRSDGLADFRDLTDWGEAAGLIDKSRAEELHRLADKQKVQAADAFARAIDLREAIYSIFSKIAGEQALRSSDLDELNRSLSEALPKLRLFPTDGAAEWRWLDDPQSLDQILWPVARSAADLLTSDQLDRVSECADDRGCGYLFIDTSRNHSRRWCSMESCGNRAKARRHYRRTSGKS